MNYLYICCINDERQNLRPGQATKFIKRTSNCFLGKTKNGVQLAI